MSKDNTIHLDNLRIYDMSGVARIPLNGTFSFKSLADNLIKQWVPYFECHQCGRFDYCKFVIRVPNNKNRAKDIKCGVATSAIRSLVKYSWEIITAADNEKRQHFLDGAFHFFQFVYNSELRIAIFLDEDILNWYDTYAPLAFGQVASLRTHLDKFAYHFGNFKMYHTIQSVLLVEGMSEKMFIETLKLSHFAWFTHLMVRTYKGKSNTKLKRIEMLLEHYKKQGYRTYIQGDADGMQQAIPFSSLVKKGLVLSNNSFVFKYDFESSIPPRLLFNSLKIINELIGVKYNDFHKSVTPASESVISLLKRNLKIDLKPLKVKLAKTIASILNANEWHGNKEFMETELGKFIHFLQKIE